MSKLLSKLLSGGANSVSRSLKMFDKLDAMLDDFDTDGFMDSMLTTRDRLIQHGNRLIDTMSDFAKRVQDTVTAFTYTVPFDPEVDSLSYEIKNGELWVWTTSKTATSTTSRTSTTTIPENCDTSRMKHTVNKDKKTATIIIPKNSPEIDKLSDDMKENFDKVKEKVKGAIKIVKDYVPEEPKASNPIQKKVRTKKAETPVEEAAPTAEEVRAETVESEMPKAEKKPKTKKKKPTVKATTTKKGKVKAEVK